MSEQEREMIRREGEESGDVEGHLKRRGEGSEPSEDEAGLRREGDEPDVEGHLKR